MRHIKRLQNGLGTKSALLFVLIACFLAFYTICVWRGGTYSVIRKCISSTELIIFYPQIESDVFDTSACNNTIKNNCCGPFNFLLEENVGGNMDFEITYSDKSIISIRYEGVYVAEKTYAGNISFGITVDLKSGEILTLKDLLNETDIQKIKEKIRQEDFKVIYGGIGNEKGHLPIEEVMKYQEDFWADSNHFQFCLDGKGVLLILYGLPRYLGNYGIIQVDL